MRKVRSRSFQCLGLLLLLIALGCGKEPGSPPNATSLRVAESPTHPALNLEGRSVNPFDDSNAAAFVFIFLSIDCPISNRYAPELQRLKERFSSRGALFWLVYPNPSESNEQISAHLREFRYDIPALRDPNHLLVRKAMVRINPEVAVFTKNGQLAYHGRIDNYYAALNKERPQATTHELADALEAVLSDRHPAITNAPAIGCVIEGRE